MVTTQLENEPAIEWLELARKRFNFPKDIIRINYQADVDLLVIGFSDKPSIRGNLDYESGVIFNYDEEGNVVSVEVLDLYGIYADA